MFLGLFCLYGFLGCLFCQFPMIFCNYPLLICAQVEQRHAYKVGKSHRSNDGEYRAAAAGFFFGNLGRIGLLLFPAL
ncbi:MAG: hypothetical protein JJU11_13095, partial [Candidatus Sumerlaeia bacterium]|nr:hypothetical protein [Candidatus Sumerlaeia bacterium]